MNPAHVHLLINHLPIVGSLMAVPPLALALWRRREPGVLLGAVLVLAISGGGAVGAFFSGEPAEEVVEHRAGVSEEWIEIHEERADVATVLSVLTALGGLGALG